MTKVKGADTDETGKTTRPALIASRRTIAEYTPFLQRLLVGLADESIATALVAPPSLSLGGIAPVPADVLTHPLIDMPFFRRIGVEHLAAQLEKFRPTVLHCLCETKAALTRRLARQLDVPYVLALNSLAKRSSRLSLSPRRCTNVVVPAETIRSSAVKTYSRYADRIRRIDMGTFVDEEPVCFSDPSRLSSIVVVHSLNHLSHFEHLVGATKALVAEGYEFMVVIMGSGKAEHRLRRLLAGHGLSQVVTIVPALDPCRAVLAAGDIFVQPQPNAAFSFALLEAMGVGVAVVACAGGVDDLIVPDQTALVFEPGSEQSLRQNLARLLDDRGFARRLAGMAQTYGRDRFSVAAMISATLETYTQAQRQYGQLAR